MTGRRSSAALGRRALLVASTGALAGCSLFSGDWFGKTKVPMPGKRLDVLPPARGLEVDPTDTTPVTLPPVRDNATWPQAGGGPTHAMGNLATGSKLANEVWRTDIGDGSGYRRKLTAQPLIADNHVFTMDSDGFVDALTLADGRRIWRTSTRAKKDRSTNVGGGIAWDGGTVYAATGRAEMLAIDAGKGSIRWRVPLGMPARSAPSFADGRLFVTTIDDRLLALSAKDGQRLWSYDGSAAAISVLGQPAPAVADGLVVAGFGSGALVTLRADTGAVAWSDTLVASGGRASSMDVTSIQALPVIDQGRVFAIGLGGLMLSLDLRTGRRLWERDVSGNQTPWVAGDWVFVLSSDQQLAAIGRDDGRVRWLSQVPRWRNPEKSRGPVEWTGPLLADNRLILASSHHQALAADPTDGKVIETRRLPSSVSVPPVVASGLLFLLCDDGTLIATR